VAEIGRREKQKQIRAAAIVAAAGRLFTSKGYEATAMEDIAIEAGLAVGTVYNYFPSKSELLLAIVRDDTREVAASVEAIAKDLPAEPADALAAICGAYLELLPRHDRALWREMLRAALASPNTLAQGLFASDAALVAQLVTVLGEFQSRGIIESRFEPGRAAVALYSLFITWFMAWVASDELELGAVAELIRDGVEVVLHGLLEPAPARTTT
jgi:AcrR family transcriptional regulator